jgi:hypothetical protein
VVVLAHLVTPKARSSIHTLAQAALTFQSQTTTTSVAADGAAKVLRPFRSAPLPQHPRCDGRTGDRFDAGARGHDPALPASARLQPSFGSHALFQRVPRQRAVPPRLPPLRGRDRAFARGLCFGDGNCLACMSDVATLCNGSRRGGAWRDGCFASFADTNATSPREEALRLWFYDDDDGGDSPTPASALERLCAADREETECARCLNESARVVPELKRRRRLSRVHGDAVVVVGYTCFLRVLLDDPLPRWRVIGEHSLSSVIPLFLCHPLKLELGRACCWQSGR